MAMEELLHRLPERVNLAQNRNPTGEPPRRVLGKFAVKNLPPRHLRRRACGNLLDGSARAVELPAEIGHHVEEMTNPRTSGAAREERTTTARMMDHVRGLAPEPETGDRCDAVAMTTGEDQCGAEIGHRCAMANVAALVECVAMVVVAMVVVAMVVIAIVIVTVTGVISVATGAGETVVDHVVMEVTVEICGAVPRRMTAVVLVVGNPVATGERPARQNLPNLGKNAVAVGKRDLMKRATLVRTRMAGRT